MPLFGKKIKTDALPFKVKSKKHKKPLFDHIEGEDGGGMVFNQCHHMTIGTSITLTTTNVINNNNKETNKDDEINSMRAEVEESFSCSDKAEMHHFALISNKITKNPDSWRKLGKKMGFSDDVLKDYSSEELDILELLDSWSKAETRSATVGILIQYLWEIEEYDAALQLSREK